MTARSNTLEVWLDCDLAPACRVGTLAHDRGQTRFNYDKAWLKAEHVLNIDDADNRPSLKTVLTTADFYGLTVVRAQQIIEEVALVVDGWEAAADRAGISRADVELTAAAFSAHTEYRTRDEA